MPRQVKIKDTPLNREEHAPHRKKKQIWPSRRLIWM